MVNNSVRRLSLPENKSQPIQRIETNLDDVIEGKCIPEIVICKCDNEINDLEIKNFIITKSPPNGGYGWLIVISAFMCSFIVDGTAFSFNIFFDLFLVQFNKSKSLTALSGSLLTGVYHLVGPISSYLINLYGCRKIMIIGSLIAFFGLYASSFATNIFIHILLYGIITGIGFGFLYSPGIIMVSTYFTSNRALATGISMAGSASSAFFYSFFCQNLIENFNLKSSTCILALFIGVFATLSSSLMRPLEKKIKLILPKKKLDENKKKRKNNIFNQINVYSNRRLDGDRTISECVGPNLNLLQNDLDRYMKGGIESSLSKSIFVSKNSLILQKQDLFYSGSVYQLQNKEINLNLNHLNETLITIKKKQKENLIQLLRKLFIKPDATPAKEYKREVVILPDHDVSSSFNLLDQMLDMSLFKESLCFKLIALSNFFTMMSLFIPCIYLKQKIELNVYYENELVNSKQAVFIISFMGITNTLGRLFFGWFSDALQKGLFKHVPIIRNMSALIINNFFVLIAGISTLMVPFLTAYNQMLIYSLLFGLCCSVFMCLNSIILVDLIGIKKLTNAFGLILMYRGIGIILGPPIAGLMFDFTGSYDYTFYISGILFIFSFVINLFIKKQ